MRTFELLNMFRYFEEDGFSEQQIAETIDKIIQVPQPYVQSEAEDELEKKLARFFPDAEKRIQILRRLTASMILEEEEDEAQAVHESDFYARAMLTAIEEIADRIEPGGEMVQVIRRLKAE